MTGGRGGGGGGAETKIGTGNPHELLPVGCASIGKFALNIFTIFLPSQLDYFNSQSSVGFYEMRMQRFSIRIIDLEERNIKVSWCGCNICLGSTALLAAVLQVCALKRQSKNPLSRKSFRSTYQT